MSGGGQGRRESGRRRSRVGEARGLEPEEVDHAGHRALGLVASDDMLVPGIFLFLLFLFFLLYPLLLCLLLLVSLVPWVYRARSIGARGAPPEPFLQRRRTRIPRRAAARAAAKHARDQGSRSPVGGFSAALSSCCCRRCSYSSQPDLNVVLILGGVVLLALLPLLPLVVLHRRHGYLHGQGAHVRPADVRARVASPPPLSVETPRRGRGRGGGAMPQFPTAAVAAAVRLLVVAVIWLLFVVPHNPNGTHGRRNRRTSTLAAGLPRGVV
ncbi:unnamed protein product [Ectocarpus fasciculatus]